MGIENLFILRVGLLDSPDMGHDRTPLGGGYVRPFVRFLLGSGLFPFRVRSRVRIEASIGGAVFSVSHILCEPFEVGCPDTRKLIQPNPSGDCEKIISWDDRLAARTTVSHRVNVECCLVCLPFFTDDM